MLFRLLGLVVGFLISMPVLSFGLGMVSAKDDVQVIGGVAITLALVVAWYFFGRYNVRYFSERINAVDGHRMIVFAILMGTVSLAACTTVPPGHVGIKVNAYGSNKGVDDYPVLTGRVTYNPWSTSIVEYPVFVQTVSWTKDPGEGHPANEEISFNTGDQMVVFADINLAYQLEAAKAPHFYVKFRADDIDKWTHGFLRNLTRTKFDEVAGRYKIEQIMGDNAPFLKEVRAIVQAELEPYGVHLEQMGFNGSPRPPQAVIDAINGKVKATQDAIRVENEVRQTQAQAQKDVAKAEGEAKAAIAKAEGESKANQLVNNSLSSNLLEWRRLDIQNHATSKWNGVLPVYSGGGMPLIQLPIPK